MLKCDSSPCNEYWELKSKNKQLQGTLLSIHKLLCAAIQNDKVNSATIQRVKMVLSDIQNSLKDSKDLKEEIDYNLKTWEVDINV